MSAAATSTAAGSTAAGGSAASGRMLASSYGALGGRRHAKALARRAQGEGHGDDSDGRRDGDGNAGPEARQSGRSGRALADGLADAAEEVLRHFVRRDGMDGAEHGAQVVHFGRAAGTPAEVTLDASPRQSW